MSRPIELTIRIDAMRHNLDVIRSRAATSRIWAVAKANGYGHGIDAAAAAFKNADGLAVLDLAEAIRARDAGWNKPILMIEGAFSPDELAQMAALDLQTVITTPEQAEMFAAAQRVPKVAWVKLNTGMNRLGFGAYLGDERIVSWCKSVRAKTAGPLGWMMHFADADSEHGWQKPLELFSRWQPKLGALMGETAGEVSLANSAAALSLPATHRDWVRPGIALYGATPYADEKPDHSAAAFGLKAGQSLATKVIAIQEVRKGETVGYGSRFRAMRDTRIGVLAAGYADGYPRLARDGTPVWIEGSIAPIAGRVSMDLITVDLGGHPSARVGSDAELWGERVAIDVVAAAAGTVGYELMTKVTARVARKRVDGQG